MVRSGLVVTDLLLILSRYETSITELLLLLPNLELQVLNSIVVANGENVNWLRRECEGCCDSDGRVYMICMQKRLLEIV